MDPDLGALSSGGAGADSGDDSSLVSSSQHPQQQDGGAPPRMRVMEEEIFDVFWQVSQRHTPASQSVVGGIACLTQRGWVGRLAVCDVAGPAGARDQALQPALLPRARQAAQLAPALQLHEQVPACLPTTTTTTVHGTPLTCLPLLACLLLVWCLPQAARHALLRRLAVPHLHQQAQAAHRQSHPPHACMPGPPPTHGLT